MMDAYIRKAPFRTANLVRVWTILRDRFGILGKRYREDLERIRLRALPWKEPPTNEQIIMLASELRNLGATVEETWAGYMWRLPAPHPVFLGCQEEGGGNYGPKLVFNLSMDVYGMWAYPDDARRDFNDWLRDPDSGVYAVLSNTENQWELVRIQCSLTKTWEVAS